MANVKIAAGTYYYDFLPGGENDFIRHVDECVLTKTINIVMDYLNNNISDCNTGIKEADHPYTNKYNLLENAIINNI